MAQFFGKQSNQYLGTVKWVALPNFMIIHRHQAALTVGTNGGQADIPRSPYPGAPPSNESSDDEWFDDALRRREYRWGFSQHSSNHKQSVSEPGRLLRLSSGRGTWRVNAFAHWKKRQADTAEKIIDCFPTENVIRIYLVSGTYLQEYLLKSVTNIFLNEWERVFTTVSWPSANVSRLLEALHHERW